MIVVNNKQHQFTKTDIKYLENLSYRTALEVDRYKIDQTVPNKPFIQEWREADLLDIFETVKLLMTSLGFPLFDPLRKEVEKNQCEDAESSPIKKGKLFHISGKNIKASGYLEEEGFVVLAESLFAKVATTAFRESQIKEIKQLIVEKVLIDRGENYLLTKDLLFSSPSKAASYVKQSSINGWLEWKTDDGKSLSDIYIEILSSIKDVESSSARYISSIFFSDIIN